MPLKIFKKKEEPEEEEYIELKLEGEHERKDKIIITVESLNNFADSDRIQKKVRDGNIVLIKIKELKEKDIGELKRAISKISKTCTAIGGDIAGVSDDWVVATPHYATIEREKK